MTDVKEDGALVIEYMDGVVSTVPFLGSEGWTFSEDTLVVKYAKSRQHYPLVNIRLVSVWYNSPEATQAFIERHNRVHEEADEGEDRSGSPE